MEIQSPEEFRDQPVIDIDVRYVGGEADAYTINDEESNPVMVSPTTIRFRFADMNVAIERRNVLSWATRERIDRIPVLKQNGAPTQASATAEGGDAGDETA